MLTVAAQTLRARWVGFSGSVLALVLGVAQIAAVGLLLCATASRPDRAPERFASAPAVVFATDPSWNPVQHDLHQRSLEEAQGVDPALLTDLRETGPVAVDRSFEARIAGGPENGLGHPWEVARYGGYDLESGAAPAGNGQIVVPRATGLDVGDRVGVWTADGANTYTVSGITNDVGYEDAVFFSAAEAARISPRIQAVVPTATLERVRQVTGDRAQVLTGERRHILDDSRAQDLEDIDNTVTLLPVMASVAGVTAVFVVASTFAFTVVQRRREIALLRAVGATGRQVRRMVLGEAVLVGAGASLAGCALGLAGANVLAGWLHRLGVSPEGFGIHGPYLTLVVLPLVAAFACGVLMAVLGVVVAAGRASRIRPLEALREADTDDTAGQNGRRVVGGLALATALGVVVWIGWLDPRITLSPNNYVPLLLVPVIAFALLAPVAVGPLTRVLMRPLAGSRHAGPMLVRQSTLTARRRTAATAAPVLLTVGIATSLLGATASVGLARDNGVRNRVTAPFTIAPDGAPGISLGDIDRMQEKLPGARIVAPVHTTVYTQDEGEWDENEAEVIYGGALTDVMRLPMVAGSAEGLDAATVVVPEVWNYRLGESVEMNLGVGNTQRLKVIGVYEALRGDDIGYLSADYANTTAFASNGMARRAYLVPPRGTDADQVRAALGALAGTAGLKVQPTAEFQVTEDAAARHLIEVRQRSVAVIVVLFCFIAVLNTLLMATADRRRDLAVLRMAGATPRQVLGVFAGESLLVGLIGVILALVASALNLAGLRVALGGMFGTTSIEIPWTPVAGIALTGLVLAVLGAVVPALAAGRGPAGRRAGLRE
ncbi:ABC transporter permease [Kineosporia sp. J2-2]|uniref:ABC transporter permease n=1 Tax=Kineosporia corallincola TaxID=2835133 RepID=A0ABS5TG91_9ACTN|nr:FtsX-like permease family protein [Kineosporia corallincola]MBT0770091.1 ABC transporter permease [Kineosporia corallincola]